MKAGFIAAVRAAMCAVVCSVLALAAGPVRAQPATAPAAAPAQVQTTLTHGLFRDVLVSRPLVPVQQFVLLLSPDAGAADADLARAMVATGALVATIDVAPFLQRLEAQSGDCTGPVGALENLSHHIQAEYRLPTYLTPLLVGRGPNAALAYALLAQSPADVIGGALSLDFCPELRLTKPLCNAVNLRQQRRAPGESADLLLPATQLAAPWVALNAENASCAAKGLPDFMAQVKEAQALPAIPASAPAADRQARFNAAYALLAKRHTALDAPPASLADLPIVEVPAVAAGAAAAGATPSAPGSTSASAGANNTSRFAVLLSGDGGWAGIDKTLAANLAGAGVSVVGLDSLRYFWSARTPEGLAADLDRVIRYYAARWKKKEVVLIGYSQGADVLPFAFNRLPAKTRAAVRTVALLGPGPKASFEFHVTNWIGASGDEPLAPEVAKLRAAETLCIYGLAERNSLCPTLPATQATVVGLPGDHHFNSDYTKLTTLILEQGGRR